MCVGEFWCRSAENYSRQVLRVYMYALQGVEGPEVRVMKHIVFKVETVKSRFKAIKPVRYQIKARLRENDKIVGKRVTSEKLKTL